MTDDKPGGDQSLPPDMAERMRKATESTRKRQVDKALARAPKASVARYAAVIILVVLTLGMVVSTVGAGADHEQQVRENFAQIGEMESALAQSRVDAENLPDAEVLIPALDEASIKGEELGDIQNQMAGLDLDAEDRSKALTEYGELVTESEGYFSTGSMTGGSFLPQGQWFQPHEPGRNFDGDPAWVRLNPKDWTWKTIPTKSVDGSGNVVVLWTAELVAGPQSGTLMAWVTGKYDSRRGAFFDLARGRTPEGDKRLGATTSPPEDSEGNVSLKLPPSTKELIDQARRETSQRAGDRRSGKTGKAESAQEPTEGDSGTADSGLGGN